MSAMGIDGSGGTGGAPPATSSSSSSPSDFLKAIKGKPVLVKLNSGVDYRGVLACLDGYMNIAMEQTEVRVACAGARRARARACVCVCVCVRVRARVDDGWTDEWTNAVGVRERTIEE
jgi:small nuclear ribonucleoprotein (snRNP)-like protein